MHIKENKMKQNLIGADVLLNFSFDKNNQRQNLWYCLMLHKIKKFTYVVSTKKVNK